MHRVQGGGGGRRKEKKLKSQVEILYGAPDGIWSPNANEITATCKSTTFLSKNMPTVRYYLLSIPLLLQNLQKNIFMGKDTAAVTLVKPLQAVILNSIYPWENETSTN